MIDDGIDLTHPGLADASVTEHFFGGTTKESSTTYTDEARSPNSFSHGTSVAGSILSNGQVTDHFLNFYGNANGRTPARIYCPQRYQRYSTITIY